MFQAIIFASHNSNSDICILPNTLAPSSTHHIPHIYLNKQQNKNMCDTHTNHHTVCFHNPSTTTKCPAYTSKPKRKCTKTSSESTHFSLCPKCQAPPQSRNQRTEEEKATVEWRTEEEVRGLKLGEEFSMKKMDSGAEKSMSGSEKGSDSKGMFGGAKWMSFRSSKSSETGIGSRIRDIVGSGKEPPSPSRGTDTAGKSPLESTDLDPRKEGDLTRNHSERYAKSYQRVIGGPHIGKDIEYMTTWSRFIPKAGIKLHRERVEISRPLETQVEEDVFEERGGGGERYGDLAQTPNQNSPQQPMPLWITKHEEVVENRMAPIRPARTPPPEERSRVTGRSMVPPPPLSERRYITKARDGHFARLPPTAGPRHEGDASFEEELAKADAKFASVRDRRGYIHRETFEKMFNVPTGEGEYPEWI